MPNIIKYYTHNQRTKGADKSVKDYVKNIGMEDELTQFGFGQFLLGSESL